MGLEGGTPSLPPAPYCWGWFGKTGNQPVRAFSLNQSLTKHLWVPLSKYGKARSGQGGGGDTGPEPHIQKGQSRKLVWPSPPNVTSLSS